MTECPYFFYGAAIDNPGQYCQYGLYNPVLDCFVLVHSDLSMLRLLLKLFSSRYYLILCRLDLAQNFDKNLLDNSVCINWTVENSDQFLFTKIQNFTSKEIEVAFLKEKTQKVSADDLLIQDRKYLFAAASWLNLLEHQKYRTQLWPVPYSDVEEIFPDQCVLSDRHPYKKFCEKIYKIIYNVFEFDQAQDLITQTFSEYSYEINPIDLCIDRA
jgi:hypothetical protein